MRILQHAVSVRTVRNYSVGLILIAALAACAGGGGSVDVAPNDPAPIRLDVSRIEIVDLHRPIGAEPFVEHLLDPSPAKATAEWSGERFTATGVSGVAVFAIENGRIRRSRLDAAISPTGSDLERYDASLRLRVTLRRPDAKEAEAIIEAERTLDAPARMSEATVRTELDVLVAQLLEDLTRETERRLRQLDGDWVRG